MTVEQREEGKKYIRNGLKRRKKNIYIYVIYIRGFVNQKISVFLTYT